MQLCFLPLHVLVLDLLIWHNRYKTSILRSSDAEVTILLTVTVIDGLACKFATCRLPICVESFARYEHAY